MHYKDNGAKPGCNIAFGGGIINRYRKIEDVDPLYVKEFRESHDNLIRSTRRHSDALFHFGHTCIRIKDSLPHREFGKFLTRHFSYVSKSTIERAMRIARYFNIEDFPIFKFLPQDLQLKLITKHPFETVVAILKDNNISLEIDENDPDQIREFIRHLKQLIEGNMGFSTITEDEINAEKTLGPGGWEELKMAANSTPDTDIVVGIKVDSTEYVLNSYLDFVKNIRECYSDIGKTLKMETTCALLSIITEIIETIQLVGPAQITKLGSMEHHLGYFSKILNELELSDDNDSDDFDNDARYNDGEIRPKKSSNSVAKTYISNESIPREFLNLIERQLKKMEKSKNPLTEDQMQLYIKIGDCVDSLFSDFNPKSKRYLGN